MIRHDYLLSGFGCLRQLCTKPVNGVQSDDGTGRDGTGRSYDDDHTGRLSAGFPTGLFTVFGLVVHIPTPLVGIF